MNTQTKPHEGAAMTGELKNSKVPFAAPPDGFLKCCKCGATQRFNRGLPYDDQSACIDFECDGQMFCNQWVSWRK